MRALLLALFAVAIMIGWRSGGHIATVPPVASAVPSRGQPGEGKGSVEIARNADGHFAVGGDVAGVGMTFVIDTGATGVTLGRDDAARIGLRLADADFTGEARTASGTVRVAHAALPRLRVGGIQLRDVAAIVIDADHVMPLLGQSFLSRLDQVSIAHDRMTLTKG